MERIIDERDIKYLVIAKSKHDKRNLIRLKEKLGSAYGFPEGEYTLDKEINYLKSFLNAQSANVIHRSNNLEIYEM